MTLHRKKPKMARALLVDARQWKAAGDFAEMCRENMECLTRSRTDRAYWFARWHKAVKP